MWGFAGALLGTLAGALASIIGTLILYTHPERLLPLLLIAGLAGALTGALLELSGVAWQTETDWSGSRNADRIALS